MILLSIRNISGMAYFELIRWGIEMNIIVVRRIAICLHKSVYATKFHPKVLWPQCKVNVKWFGNFFYKSLSFCFFREKFGFE